MAGKQKKSSAFSIYITVLVILLILAIVLFVYGSVTNGMIQPRLPGHSVFAMGRMLHHG